MSNTKNYIQSDTGPWEIVLGLEVHAQITSKSKLFSPAATAFGAGPNQQVSLVDAAMPGMLPVINSYCVEQAVKTGLGLNAKINYRSVFDRKNYFYADLPQGYQISQFTDPIVGEGVITLDMSDGTTFDVGITRLHLEQDAGKSMHDQSPTKTYVDLNRSGIALMEVVSEPDMRCAEHAAAYVRKLRTILRYLGTCDGNMDEGSLRCDVNVSVRRPGEALGTRCEIKNMNSVKFIQQAIEYEARRQIDVLESGGTIDQETRLWDTQQGKTRSMRSKEDAQDYRYFPDPDLIPLHLDPAWVGDIQTHLPELPDVKKNRFIQDFALSLYDASVLVVERERANYFEAVVAKCGDGKLAANWVISNLLGALKKAMISLEENHLTPEDLGELLAFILDNTISGKIAKEVFATMFETGKKAAAIIEEQGLKQVTDTSEIKAMINPILEAHADKVAEYRSGKDKLFGFFVGQVMKAAAGKANPQMLNQILKQQLDQS